MPKYDWKADPTTGDKIAEQGIKLAELLQELFIAHPELFNSDTGKLRKEISRLRGTMGSIQMLSAGHHKELE